ncbi:MAG: HD domain-containing protein [Deltaproteobacteria bacterium]|nr:HD domain-containing protein [Deltaproteobacteria bacterium]
MGDEERTNREILEKLKEIGQLLAALGKADSEMLYRLLMYPAKALASAIEEREIGKEGHHERSANLARAIGAELHLSAERIDGLGLAAMIHDVGKISVSAEILGKTTRLDDAEMALVKTHVRFGYDLLKGLPFPWPVAQIVLEHHERMDGSGYPNGLTGDRLLMESRILVVADVVDAISCPRSYRPARGVEVALYDVKGYRGVRYDPDVVDACLLLFEEKEFKLSDD